MEKPDLRSQGALESASFSALTDEELAELCREQLSQQALCALIVRYEKLIKSLAFRLAAGSADADDFVQEGFLALLDAVRTFDPARGATFFTYSHVCIANRMTTARIKSDRTVIPPVEEPEPEDHLTPLSILLEKERANELETSVANLLSPRELDVFRLFLSGSTYDQMARRLNISSKTVDNALQRVRRKLKSVWRTDHFAFEQDMDDPGE